MARGIVVRLVVMRLLAAVVLIAAEMAAVTALLVVASAPAGAQLFDDRFPFFGRNSRRGWFDPPEREDRSPPPDFSKAPAPKKTDAVPQTPIMVFGDSMADWLAYGLEQAFTDTPEIGILRRHRTSSGLIRTEVRNDPRGEYPDWPGGGQGDDRGPEAQIRRDDDRPQRSQADQGRIRDQGSLRRPKGRHVSAAQVDEHHARASV